MTRPARWGGEEGDVAGHDGLEAASVAAPRVAALTAGLPPQVKSLQINRLRCRPVRPRACAAIGDRSWNTSRAISPPRNIFQNNGLLRRTRNVPRRLRPLCAKLACTGRPLARMMRPTTGMWPASPVAAALERPAVRMRPAGLPKAHRLAVGFLLSAHAAHCAPPAPHPRRAPRPR